MGTSHKGTVYYFVKIKGNLLILLILFCRFLSFILYTKVYKSFFYKYVCHFLHHITVRFFIPVLKNLKLL